MSNVVESKHNQNDLEVLNFAEDLLAYTFDICNREKNVRAETDTNKNAKIKKSAFPLKYWSCFTKYLVEYASLAYDNLYFANQYNLYNNYESRQKHQTDAIAYLNAMLPKIHFAWHRFSIKTNSIEFWSKLIVQTIEKAKAWKKSDEKRYLDFLQSLQQH